MIRKVICILLSFSFLLLYLPRSKAEQELQLPRQDILISMDLQNANLKDVLKIFSIQSGLNFICSEAVQDRLITLYLDKVPIQEALNKLFKVNNLAYDFDPQANIIIVKDWGRPQIETITKVFYLKHASVSSSPLKQEKKKELAYEESGVASESGVTSAVKKLLSSDGTVIEDARTNSLIVTDTPNRISVISQAIAALDVPIPQVMLEVEMLDVNKNVADLLGVDWSEAHLASLDVSGMRLTRFPFSGSKADNREWFAQKTIKSPSGNWEFSNFTPNRFLPSVLTVIGAQLTLDFLKTQTDTKVLARPRILTLNNEVAEIKVTTQETVGSKVETTNISGSSTSTTTQSAERMETGISLRVSPQVNPETGEITMFIMPRVADTKPVTAQGTSSTKDPEERLAKSVVKVKDGETIIIGGLIHNQFSQKTTEVPFFSKIPIFGAIFRHKDKDKDTERELLVFITPHIVKDSNVALVQTKGLVLPEREQGTLSGFDRQALISNSLSALEQKIKK